MTTALQLLAIVTDHHGGEAAVYEQQLTSDKIGIVGYQEQDRSREIYGAPGATTQIDNGAGRIEIVFADR